MIKQNNNLNIVEFGNLIDLKQTLTFPENVTERILERNRKLFQKSFFCVPDNDSFWFQSVHKWYLFINVVGYKQWS